MDYGRFDHQNREFVIERPDTPTPWINYLGDQTYGGIISNTAGGFSFDGDPKYRRLLRYRYNNLPMDRPGRYIYIKEAAEPGQNPGHNHSHGHSPGHNPSHYWSPTWAPVNAQLDSYKCRHGLGYSIITGVRNGLSAEGLFFIPPGVRLEIWRWRFRNMRQVAAQFRTFSYAEFCPFDADNDLTNLDWTQQIAQAWYNEQERTIYFTTHMRTTGCIFVHSSQPPLGFDCDRESFIGNYRSESNPAAVERGTSGNTSAYRGNGIASFSHEWRLEPGETAELTLIMGIAPDERSVPKALKPFADNPQQVDRSFTHLRECWQDRLSRLSAITPNQLFDETVNTWNPYQCMTTFNWARFVSLYECGIRRGIGFRDSCQDTLGVVHCEPAAVKERLTRLLGKQFSIGDAYHQYYPFTDAGDLSGYSDDHLWAVLAVCQYLKETGDFAFLEKSIPYADCDGGGGASGRGGGGAGSGAGGGTSTGSVYEHLCRAVEFSLNNTGPHGIPRLGFADWNDALNLPAGQQAPESVLVGQLLCRALLDLSELAAHIGKSQDATRFREAYASMAKRINETAWDGSWYIRAWQGDGTPLGSSLNKGEGEIFLNTQSWAVISGIADRHRAATCMHSALERLNTPNGLMLLAPPFRKYDAAIGGCTTYPPGAKENGGIFVQTNPWAIIAAAMMGDGELSWRLYDQIMPANHLQNAEVFQAEPYVFCQNILGTPHPLYGLGRNSWLTGTAAWAYVAATQYILGIRPDYDRLIIDPCIPPHWSGFKAVRHFRGTVYQIEVLNPERISRGVKSITVDGQPVAQIAATPGVGDVCAADTGAVEASFADASAANYYSGGGSKIRKVIITMGSEV